MTTESWATREQELALTCSLAGSRGQNSFDVANFVGGHWLDFPGLSIQTHDSTVRLSPAWTGPSMATLRERERAVRIFGFVLALAATSVAFAAESPSWAAKDLRAGIIGTDTSHVPTFTGAFLSHPEWRIKVVAAFKAGSPDLPIRADRVNGFATTIHDKYGVELVGSIEELLQKVDVVLLESVDGRPHLAQATPVLNAGKRLFIDKPLAVSLDDARRIVQLSKETGTPFFSSSSTRFHPEIPQLRRIPGWERSSRSRAVRRSNRFNITPTCSSTEFTVSKPCTR